MTNQNLDYYRQRAGEELAAAEQAGDSSVAKIHRDMALRYRDLFNGKSDLIDGRMAKPMEGPFCGAEGSS